MRLVQGKSPMLSTRRVPQLLALRRTDAVVTDAIISSVAQSAKAAGLKLAGVLQRDLQRPGRRRCDMDLTDLASGEVTRISEDRGNLARGCRMDTSALVEAARMVESSICGEAPDLVILNKFGKAEEEGGGMRGAIASALTNDVPVLMSVGELAIPALKLFAGELCRIVEADSPLVCDWLLHQFGGKLANAVPNPILGTLETQDV